MNPHLEHLLVGLTVGLVARMLLPGHATLNLGACAALGGAGGWSISYLSRRWRVYGARQLPAYAMSAMGALLCLLLISLVY